MLHSLLKSTDVDAPSTSLYFGQLKLCLRVSAAVGLLTLAACASTPKAPDQALQAAELAITTAEQARVADYASPELGEARLKLSAARAAVQEKNMVQAERLAQQARADAELALAKADAAKAKAVNEELNKSTEILKTEMQRNTEMPK